MTRSRAERFLLKCLQSPPAQSVVVCLKHVQHFQHQQICRISTRADRLSCSKSSCICACFRCRLRVMFALPLALSAALATLQICTSADQLLLPQRAQAAFAAREFDTARYWFELIRTWDPAAVAADLATCKAACPTAAPAERGSAGDPKVTAPRQPPIGH